MTTLSAESRDSVREAVERVTSARSMTIDGAEVFLSDELRDGIRELLQHAAAGEEVDILVRPDYLTTQQAAQILRVSRPTLVKMLDEGLIPHERPGTHRRIRREALDEYLEAETAQRSRALDDLADTFDPEIPEQAVSTR